MAKPIEALKIAIDFQDKRSQVLIEKIVGSLTKLQSAANGSTPRIKALRQEIIQQGNASLKSVSNINAQRTALAALRDEARIGGKNFKQLTEDIKKLDAELAKAKPAERRRGGARQATQIAGAVISGGIFGGPEGALGAVGGAALGGVEGAFAGAAIGATLGGVREAIGGTAEYAASIDKLKIALQGVAPSSDDYNSALATAKQVTEELNVPQQAAISGITRLTAAVVGANGPVADAETVFKNVTAAIKATGGNSEDVQGAITAMVQVFSKGKVSAEELSGQLGERLPGAVTLFAKANNMSLQELQDNLKKGTVGLNELMAFVRELGNTYGGTAREISQSGAEAGARLTVSVNELQLAVGEAMKGVGAGFQEGFSEFIEDITPAAVKAAKGISDALKALGPVVLTLSKNLDTVAVSLAGALGAAGIAAIISQIVKAKGVVAALTVAVKALNLAMLKNPIFLAAMGGAIAVGGIYALTKAISKQADEVERLNRANKLATKVENASYSQGSQEVARDLGEAIRGRGAARQDLLDVNKEIDKLKPQFEALGDLEESPVRYLMQGLRDRQRAALESVSKFDETIRKLKPLLATDKELGVDESTYERPKSGGEDKDKDKGLANRIKAAQALERRQIARLNLSQAESKLSQLLAKQLNERKDLQAKIGDLTKKGSDEEITRATNSALTNQKKAQELQLTKAINSMYKQAKKPIEDIVKKVQDKVKFDKEYKDLLAQGVNPEIAKEIINIKKARDAGLDKFDVLIEELEAKKLGSELDKQELQDIEDSIAALKRKAAVLRGDADTAITDVRNTQKEKTFMDGLTQAIEDQKSAIEDLIDPLKQVTSFANAMGESFKASFKGIIDGSMTGKQALASFFSSIADYFADMAAQIAAEALKLAALQFVKFIFSSFVGGGASTQSAFPTDVGGYQAFPGGGPSFRNYDMFAQGGVFENKIVPYAKGGLVDKPTVFEYANGGSGRFGLMGEAGPEAIMPLTRGADGKLGVEAHGAASNDIDIVVNVDASSSNVQSDGQQGKALGQAIGAAVQAELIKQKRPGGLLS